MILYAIAHITDGYLCLTPTGKGNSFSKPTHQGVPRLFLTLRAAQAALRAWLLGEWRRHVSVSWEGDADDSVKVVDVGRKAEHMRIVKLSLLEVTP